MRMWKLTTGFWSSAVISSSVVIMDSSCSSRSSLVVRSSSSFSMPVIVFEPAKKTKFRLFSTQEWLEDLMSAPEQRSQRSRTTKLSFARPPTSKQDPKSLARKECRTLTHAQRPTLRIQMRNRENRGSTSKYQLSFNFNVKWMNEWKEFSIWIYQMIRLASLYTCMGRYQDTPLVDRCDIATSHIIWWCLFCMPRIIAKHTWALRCKL